MQKRLLSERESAAVIPAYTPISYTNADEYVD